MLLVVVLLFQTGTILNNSLLYFYLHFHDRHVLTAAHCFEDCPPHEVRLGKYFLKNQTFKIKINETNYEAHENYKFDKTKSILQNDIAIITLPEPIEFSEVRL